MANERAQLIRFVKSAGRYGAGSFVLAALSLVVSIYEHLIGKNIPAYWLLLLAALSFCVGAYLAWAATETFREGPRLKLSIKRAFFDVVAMNNEVVVEIHTYIEVTNIGTAETTIDDASLSMTVHGKPLSGDWLRSSGANAIEHSTDFRLGAEVKTQVFENTLSPFRRLARREPQQPLRVGLTQEGFLTFSFPDLKQWDHENLYSIRATEIRLSLRDSFGQLHSTTLPSMKISNGVPRQDARFDDSPK